MTRSDAPKLLGLKPIFKRKGRDDGSKCGEATMTRTDAPDSDQNLGPVGREQGPGDSHRESVHLTGG